MGQHKRKKDKYRIKYQYGIWSIVDENDKILANWRDENSAKAHLYQLKKYEFMKKKKVNK